MAVLQASFWLRLAGVALGKYFFTTLAGEPSVMQLAAFFAPGTPPGPGVDWMLAEIGRQRHYEQLWRSVSACRKHGRLKMEISERIRGLEAEGSAFP